MSLRYKYNRACRIIDRLSPEDLKTARSIAGQIRTAEEKLLQRADGHFDRCVSVCKGLCCRNVDIDPIISHWDFVYILTMDRSMAGPIQACLDQESPFFTSDCIFLENGRGPCLFPFNLRPEVCITTFCTGTKPIKREITLLKRSFFKLQCFIMFAGFKSRCMSLFKLSRSPNGQTGG